MKKIFLLAALTIFSPLAHSKEPLFFFSSDKIVQQKQGSLKSLDSFVFFPLLKIEEKNADKVTRIIDQELEKVAILVRKPAVTSEGVDLESYPNPSLQFTLEQLVDEKNKPLPVLQATLTVNTAVALGKDQSLSSLNTNRWSTYIEPSKDIQGVVRKTLSHLLKQFSADFQSANGPHKKPTFYISYDSSTWKPAASP